MSTIAVLPVKRFDEAKQRLGETMRSGTRRALAEAMLIDVLTALRALLVPGDCPALDPTEVDDLLLAHPHSEARVTIVPDRHGTGTNALVLCPPDAISPSFGEG